MCMAISKRTEETSNSACGVRERKLESETEMRHFVAYFLNQLEWFSMHICSSFKVKLVEKDHAH